MSAHVPALPLEADPLIAEAKRRARRRRLIAAAFVTALAVGGLAAAGVLSGRSTAPRSSLAPVVDARAFRGHGNLAFVSRGRLWLLDGSTGTLVRAAAGGASSPTFSPNGRWLAWSQGPRFGIARADGTGSQLAAAHGSAPAWLPDGRLLVGRAIYRIENGLPTRTATAPRGLVSWAADGSRYAFVETRLDGRRHPPDNDVERVEVSRSLNGPRRVWYETPESFTTRSGWEDPAVGPVAILPRAGILIWLDPFHSASIAADGLAVYAIRSPLARPRKLGVTLGRQLSLAPGGRFALGAGGDRIAWTNKQVVTCTLDGCRPFRSRGRMTLDPAWSPDGRTLAYVTGSNLGVDMSGIAPTVGRWYATRRLWIGHDAVPGSSGAASPVWSSDGRSLLFVAHDGLWLLPQLGERPVRVAEPLFRPGRWPNYYGQVDWADRFAWHS
jgi:TolB protein